MTFKNNNQRKAVMKKLSTDPIQKEGRSIIKDANSIGDKGYKISKSGHRSPIIRHW